MKNGNNSRLIARCSFEVKGKEKMRSMQLPLNVVRIIDQAQEDFSSVDLETDDLHPAEVIPRCSYFGSTGYRPRG